MLYRITPKLFKYIDLYRIYNLNQKTNYHAWKLLKHRSKHLSNMLVYFLYYFQLTTPQSKSQICQFFSATPIWNHFVINCTMSVRKASPRANHVALLTISMYQILSTCSKHAHTTKNNMFSTCIEYWINTAMNLFFRKKTFLRSYTVHTNTWLFFHIFKLKSSKDH